MDLEDALNAHFALRASGSQGPGFGEGLSGEKSSTRSRCPSAVALVMGHEVRGVAARTKSNCDLVVKLPVFGDRALNVGVAAGQAGFMVADRWGLAQRPATVRRLGALLLSPLA